MNLKVICFTAITQTIRQLRIRLGSYINHTVCYSIESSVSLLTNAQETSVYSICLAIRFSFCPERVPFSLVITPHLLLFRVVFH